MGLEQFGRRLFYVARFGAPKSALESTDLNVLQGLERDLARDTATVPAGQQNYKQQHPRTFTGTNSL